MKYHAKKETIDTITKYERVSFRKLRKISILKNIPLREWTSLELEDFIYEYDIIMNHSSKNGDIGRLQNEYESIFRTINVK